MEICSIWLNLNNDDAESAESLLWKHILFNSNEWERELLHDIGPTLNCYWSSIVWCLWGLCCSSNVSLKSRITQVTHTRHIIQVEQCCRQEVQIQEVNGELMYEGSCVWKNWHHCVCVALMAIIFYLVSRLQLHQSVVTVQHAATHLFGSVHWFAPFNVSKEDVQWAILQTPALHSHLTVQVLYIMDRVMPHPPPSQDLHRDQQLLWMCFWCHCCSDINVKKTKKRKQFLIFPNEGKVRNGEF